MYNVTYNNQSCTFKDTKIANYKVIFTLNFTNAPHLNTSWSPNEYIDENDCILYKYLNEVFLNNLTEGEREDISAGLSVEARISVRIDQAATSEISLPIKKTSYIEDAQKAPIS